MTPEYPWTMTQPERVLFVHAHPDDETIATGGTLATLVDAGAVVTVLTCTRGERGEVIPADLKDALGSPETMATLRESELRTALGILGVSDHRFLGDTGARWGDRAPRRYVDSGMSWGTFGAEASDEFDPASLTSADFGDVAADVAAVILAVQPHAVVSYNERGGYGHPDHIRAHEAARRAAEVYGVPFYAVEPSESSAPVTLQVDVSAAIDRKRAALGAYRSQVEVRGDEFALSNGSLHAIDRVEKYRRIAVGETGSVPFREPNPCSRIAISLVAGLIGVGTGALVSVYNQSTLRIFGVEIWAGTIFGILLLALLLVGLRLAFETRVVAFWAAVGAILIVAAFTQPSAGGTLLIPTFSGDGAVNLSGLVWSLAPVVVAIVVLVWPQILRPAPDRIAGHQTVVKGPPQP
jgi:N-acetyl-1-D-myo-inositol-2-amino-2-deoxy-alpha-D-glucopyranoside deacetylase